MDKVTGQLEDLWQNGQMRDLEGDLDLFIRDHLTDIRGALREGKARGLDVARRRYTRGEITDHDLVDFCVRSILMRRQTCNPRRDIQEQVREINKEVWYEGERCQVPVTPERREEIARKWASTHAPRWREWRLYQLLYVWQKKADDYVRMISTSEPAVR